MTEQSGLFIHAMKKGIRLCDSGDYGRTHDTFIVANVDCPDCIFLLNEDATIKETEGVRDNAGKPMLSPIDPMLLLEMAKGLQIGQEKYGEKAFNREGNTMALSTGYDSLMRHILKFMSCYDEDDLDSDDGVHHIAKAMNCLVVMWHNRIKGDDRKRDSK